MNPQIFFEIDFSFLSSFFSLENGAQKEKNEEIFIHKNFKASKTLNETNISKKVSNKILKSDKKKDIKKEKKISNIKERIEKKLINKKPRTKDELLQFLLDYIKNVFIFKKKVKLLIQKHKENFAIISSVNKRYFPMNIQIDNRKKRILKYSYEPILNEYILYISKKLYINNNLIRFTFVNEKNESIVEPNLKTVYHKGEFYNVINLKKIRKTEKKNAEDFQILLDKFYRSKHISSEETEGEEKNKPFLGKSYKKIPDYSILKKRPIKRIISNKKITFSEKNETRHYKKD